MSEIVSKWILSRLGLVIDMTPETFAVKASNGILLAQILQSYEIITPEELNLLKDSDNAKDCYDNFSLINKWLKHLLLRVNEEDLYEIVRGVGSTALHLFYQVFLELKNKTKLDFLTENEINSQLGTRFHRFYVRQVDESDELLKLDFHRDGLCEPFLAGGDVYHWYKDRLETIQNRCKDARDEYLHGIKNKGKSVPIDFTNLVSDSAYIAPRGICPSPRRSATECHRPNVLPGEDEDSVDSRTYEELINEQKRAQEIPPFNPDPKEVKKILKNLHVKSKVRRENKVLKNTLHQEIMNEFDRKINDTKAKSEDQVLMNIFMKQSLYEKELITKLGQVKMQKEFMLDNKFRQGQILKKLKEKEFVDGLLLKDKQLNEKKLSYYFERERVIQLHKKIWAERMRLKAKRRKELCSKAVKDMVDISTKIAEYKKRFGREPNKREMEEIRDLFVSGQSIFDICEPVINIVKDFDDQIPEAIICREISRQNALDQEEFDRYMKYEWPWELKNINCSTENFHHITYGLNVLGRIVHRALDVKYPITPLWDTPQFPEATIRVCINGIKDLAILPNLNNLLSGREIQVIQLTQAVDFCIAAYKEESKREYQEDDTVPVKEGKHKKEKPTKPKKGQKPSKKRKGNVDENVDNPYGEPIKKMENKQVQTPIKYPCEEIVYSPGALLGKTAQELLDEGRPLGDFLLIAMFVEYLKSIPNLKGWVLINYPTTLEQAAILEEALTGVKLVNPVSKSDIDKSLSEFTEQEQGDEKDECSLTVDLDVSRCSRLLPNPVEPEPVKIYDTVLTAYIKIKKLTFDDKTGDAILPPPYEELGNEPDPLDKFYSDVGANYSMYYKEFDPTTIKYLGKLIIGDYSLPLKSSLELFGDVADLDGRASKSVKATKKGEKVKKPKMRMEQETTVSDKTSTKVGKEGAGKKDKKGKTKVVIVYEDKYVQVPSEDEEEIEEIFVKKSLSEPPGVGQPGWEYTNNIGPEDLMIALATLWESIEDIYITELRETFFLRRLNLNSIMPYSQYIKDVMATVIDRPDYKGFFLAKFQKAFNAFTMDFRQDDEFKAEMHCRIEDFKEKMTELCDIKMMDSENMRCKIIQLNWTPLQITELINDYLNMIQIEMDRFIETMRFVNDFYLGAVTGMPSDEENYKEENFLKFHNISSEFINNMFLDSTSSIDLTYFDELFLSVIQRTLHCIKRLNSVAMSCMDKTKILHANSTKSKSKAGSPRSKASKDTKKTADQDAGIKKEDFDKLLEEWQCAVKGETLRVTLRVDLIKYNALEAIEEFLKEIQKAFHGVYNEIRTKYWNEIENVRRACRVFQTAVENQLPIQKELIFQGHEFRINPELNLFDNPPIIPKLPEEVIEEGAFTISQLSKLADILLDLSPSGYMPRGTFTFILQDIIWITPEDGSQWLSPKLWRKLNSQQLKFVIDSLYDNLEYVYWRDFIIYNIRINFPTERELLLTRNALRECDPDGTELIQNYQFFATKLWFEYVFRQEDAKKIMEIKRLLYKIYSIKNYGLNYTALLLDFCKDERAIEGFAKALELSIGKIVCWDKDMGNIFEEEYLIRMKEHDENVKRRDQERDEYYKAVHEELSKLVDYVVHITESVVIEDLDIPEEKTEPTSSSTTKQSILKKTTEERAPKRSSRGEEIKFKEFLEVVSKDEEVAAVASDNELVPQEETTESLELDGDKIVRICSDLPDNVGTESSEFTEIIFFLSKDVVITIIMAALPWHSRVHKLGELSFWEAAAEIFEKCRNPDFSMSVLSHEFLNSDMFSVLLSQTKKFNIIDPVRVVNDILIESDRNSE